MSDVLNEKRENQPDDGERSQLRIVVRSSVSNEREQRIDFTLDSHCCVDGGRWKPISVWSQAEEKFICGGFSGMRLHVKCDER